MMASKFVVFVFWKFLELYLVHVLLLRMDVLFIAIPSRALDIMNENNRALRVLKIWLAINSKQQ